MSSCSDPAAPLELRDFSASDADAVNRLALAAFAEYSGRYDDWDSFARRIGDMAALAESAELIVACVDGTVAGAVAYVGPGQPKAAFFPLDWPILRMLVAAPAMRGQGIGRALTLECIRRARRDGAARVGLHTSPIMQAALAMYLRLGFRYVGDAPDIHGVAYGVYALDLADDPAPLAARAAGA
jgi:ribosomal protein S18 acetylase RimI-like enzyme